MHATTDRRGVQISYLDDAKVITNLLPMPNFEVKSLDIFLLHSNSRTFVHDIFYSFRKISTLGIQNDSHVTM